MALEAVSNTDFSDLGDFGDMSSTGELMTAKAMTQHINNAYLIAKSCKSGWAEHWNKAVEMYNYLEGAWIWQSGWSEAKALYKQRDKEIDALWADCGKSSSSKKKEVAKKQEPANPGSSYVPGLPKLPGSVGSGAATGGFKFDMKKIAAYSGVAIGGLAIAAGLVMMVKKRKENRNGNASDQQRLMQ
mgnify:CR=1 FL=1